MCVCKVSANRARGGEASPISWPGSGLIEYDCDAERLTTPGRAVRVIRWKAESPLGRFRQTVPGVSVCSVGGTVPYSTGQTRPDQRCG